MGPALTPAAGSAPIRDTRGTAVRLVGVLYARDVDAACRLTPSLQPVVFRDVAAVATVCSAGRVGAQTEAQQREHHRVMWSLAESLTVLPAPVGTTFKGLGTLMQWLELHAVALGEGLAYVDGHWEARVTAARDVEQAVSDPAVLPPSAAAVESLRTLRRHARSAVSVTTSAIGDGTTIATEAFLVPRSSWIAFKAEVAAEDERSPGLLLEVSGPWPAYDFVTMQF
jgi:hypothetical protein